MPIDNRKSREVYERPSHIEKLSRELDSFFPLTKTEKRPLIVEIQIVSLKEVYRDNIEKYTIYGIFYPFTITL